MQHTNTKCSILRKATFLAIRVKKKNISKQIIEKAKQLLEFELLISFPGIGNFCATLFICEIGDILRFSNYKKVNAFIGIDIQ